MLNNDIRGRYRAGMEKPMLSKIPALSFPFKNSANARAAASFFVFLRTAAG
jgi:hypothetical protein